MKIVIENAGALLYAFGDPTAQGGSERQQWLLARALARRGHEVILFARSRTPKPQQTQEAVRIRRLTPLSPWVAWPKLLRSERPDWWYWLGAEHYLGWLALVCRLTGTKLAVGLASDRDYPARHALTRRKYLWPAYALGLLLADRILAFHPGQLARLPPALRRKARYVPSIAGEIAPAASRGNYVAWVAVLRELKRAHLVPEIARRLPHAQFVVCGPISLDTTRPKYAAALPALLAACPNIDYRGQVSPAEAQRIISHAAVFLSTSELEGLPNTFMQAWAAGVPVVSLELDPGGLIAAHGLGCVAPSLDDCAEAAARLLADPSLNESLGRNARRYAQAEHSEANAVAQFLSALDGPDVSAG